METITINKKDFDKRNAEKKIQWDKDYLKNLEKTKLEDMAKPIKPVYPDYKNSPIEECKMPLMTFSEIKESVEDEILIDN